MRFTALSATIAYAMLLKGTLSLFALASINGVHSVHCVLPYGAPHIGHARYVSIYGNFFRQCSHISMPGASHIAQRVGHIVSVAISAATCSAFLKNSIVLVIVISNSRYEILHLVHSFATCIYTELQ